MTSVVVRPLRQMLVLRQIIGAYFVLGYNARAPRSDGLLDHPDNITLHLSQSPASTCASRVSNA